MSYDYDDSSYIEARTTRIGFMCVTLVLLGFLFFLFKIDACSSKPENCKDEFHLIDNNNYNINCRSGAKAEIVTSPPAPKAGIICHCTSVPVNDAGTD